MKRRYDITVEIDEDTVEDVDIAIKEKFKFDFKFKVIDIQNVKQTRTSQQNNALHLWFTQLAETLNEKHFDMRTIIRNDIDIEWTTYTIKEYLWRPLQKALYGK
ncbi:MAG: hypothetical protein P1P85_05460, partial [Patescibacteria group bacterium]|nr:hypothetical protein [Patescibacteria group bacterium]